MARVKPSVNSSVNSNLLQLVASDSEDDLGGVHAKTKRSSIRDMPPAKRGRPAAAASAGAKATTAKVTKPKKETSTVRRTNEKKAAAAVAAAAAAAAAAEAETASEDETADSSALSAAGRQALADRTNELAAASEPAAVKSKSSRGRPSRKAAAAAAEEDETEELTTVKRRGRGRPKATATAATTAAAAPKTGRRKAAAKEDDSMEQDEEQEPDTTETQLEDSMAVDGPEDKTLETTMTDGGDESTMADQTEASTIPPQSPVRSSRPAQRSVDAAGDASMRRRLGDLTKKHDSLEARFRDLRETGVKEAERNFDRLKKQGDERAKASDELIASLRAELASFRELAREGARHKREWDASVEREKALQERVDTLTAALSDAKVEARTLTTKLAAARTAESVAGPGGVGGHVPGSAMKLKGPAAAAAAAAAAAVASNNASVAQLKENLYGDLTGLLVWSARRDGTREMYDCIQTGRSGSLHFKLCVDNGAGGGHGPGAADDEAQFAYMPQLDASRDAELIERLPDYLVEEISFPRAQAAKFYGRVLGCLSKD